MRDVVADGTQRVRGVCPLDCPDTCSWVVTVKDGPEDAAGRGLESGREARVLNDRGAFVALVEVTDRVRRGVVASTKGRWPRFVRGGATVNATVDERDSDMGGGAVFHDNRVQVEPL